MSGKCKFRLKRYAFLGARSYEIIFAAFSDTNENKIVSRQSNAEVSELMPGTSYELFIVAVGQEGQLSQRSGSFIAATST